MNRIRVEFEFNSIVGSVDNIGIAKYTLLKDDIEYDEECTISLKLKFDEAYELSKLFNTLSMLSYEHGYSILMEKFTKFIDSHYSL